MMFNSTEYQRNANHNYNEIPLTSIRMAIINKTGNNKNQVGCGKKGFYSLLVGTYTGTATMENSMAVPQKK